MSQSQINAAHRKSLTSVYKHLTSEQKRIIKLKEKKDLAEKFLYGSRGFYSHVVRLPDNQVNWDCVPDETLNLVSSSMKDIERFLKVDDDLVNTAVKIFNETQFSLSQSF